MSDDREVLRKRSADEERFRTAVDDAPTGLVLVDGAGRIAHANHEVELLSGYAREELVHLTLDALFPRRAGEAPLRARVAHVAKRGVPRARRDLSLLRKDGLAVAVDVALAPSAGEGGPWFLVSIVDASERAADETERRRLEEALRHAQKSETVGALAAGVVHDVNNVLASLGAHVELALANLEDGLDHRAREELDEAMRTLAHARDVASRLLAYARRAPLERRPLELKTVVEDTLRIAGASVPDGVRVVTSLAEHLPDVNGDLVAVQQVLLNLVLNASHAMDGRGTLEVDLRLASGDHASERDRVVLVVRDDGHGMDESVLRRACEPFFSTKPPGVGTGLGLSVVRTIVEDHGGAVEIESQVGQGTEVRCLFPAVEVPLRRPDTDHSGTYTLGAGQRVLVVDDDPRLARLTARLLGQAGFLAEAATPAAVLAQAEGGLPLDAVLTDLFMPGLDGLSLARRVHVARPKVVVVLATGAAQAVDAATLATAGISAVVTKPVASHELVACLTEALARRAFEPRASYAS